MDDDKKYMLEQYKIAIDTANKTTDRRYNFNKFMIMICTALIAAIGTIIPKCPFYTIPIAILGIFICEAWIKQINCFKTMIKIKYNSVKKIEEENDYILKTYKNEYDERESAKNNENFKSLSEQEKHIAKIFKWGFIIYMLIIFIPILSRISPILFFINLLV